jgi:hypothetical protein
MVHRPANRSLFFVALSIFTGSLIVACAPSAVTQGDEAKTKLPVAPGAATQPSADAMLVLGVKKGPPPPPPSGGPPKPPPHPTPASYYEPVGPFFFYVETLTSTGPSRYGFTPTQPCIQSGVFKRGMRIVFRFEVLDTSTGKRVTDRDGATLKVVLPHGEEVAARWAIRGSVAAMPDSAWMWDSSWDIPPDYPLGSFDYRIAVATRDGRTATFTPPIQKAKTADSRVRIID